MRSKGEVEFLVVKSRQQRKEKGGLHRVCVHAALRPATVTTLASIYGFIP